MTTRIATCSCGQLIATVSAEPVRVSICHCLACQRRTGSVFGVQARFPAGTVKVTGESHEFARTGDEGGTGRFRFCPTCGTTVCWRLDALPDVVYIPVGAFADPMFPPPAVSVYESRRHAWVRLPRGVKHHD